MITAVTVLAFVTVAHALVRRFDAGPFERATYVVLLGAAMWLASVWALAVVHLLTRPMLLARTAVVLIAAVICVIRTPFRFALPADRRAWAVIAPLALWIAFVLVRAAIVPPVSHDALAYHLPKAVLYSRAQGFEIFPFLNAQIRGIPANYEMLLADSLTLDRGDAFSEWISTFFYVAFVIGSAAIAERWWRRSVLTMALAAASIPVVLLHAGAHKNDLMTAAFTVGGLVGAGRFFATRDVAPLLIAIVSFGAGTGTKPQAAMVALATAPFILWRLRSARTLALVAVCSLVAFLLLGGGFAAIRLAGSSGTAETSGSSAAQGSGTSAGSSAAGATAQSPNAAAPAVRQAPTLTYQAGGRSRPFTVLTSTADLGPGSLAREVGRLVLGGRTGAQQGTRATPEPSADRSAASRIPGFAPAALEGCVTRVADGGRVRLVQTGRYQGQQAVIIAVSPTGGGPVRIWVVGTGCSATSSDVITQMALPGAG